MHSGERWRLGHRPALDGLRGIAVLLVVASHAIALSFGEVPALAPLGPVGVGIFFTLSGFLITCLLIGDQDTTGRVRFGRFYRRRALRLFPALAALVVAEVLVTALWKPGFVNAGSVLATVFYVQNWWGVAGHDAGGLNHTWSLAIEEQFYLVWPLMFAYLARFGWRVVAGVAALIALGSAMWRAEYFWSVDDSWRLYAGTDTRLDGLLIGCVLALVMSNTVRRERARPALFVAGMAAIAWIGWYGGYVYEVVLPLMTALGTAAAIFGVGQGRGFRPLEVRWLTWCGRRSYGMYLWHVPLVGLLASSGWPVLVNLAAFLGGSLLLTVLSWRYVEEPFLAMKDRLRLREGVDRHGGWSRNPADEHGDRSSGTQLMAPLPRQRGAGCQAG